MDFLVLAPPVCTPGELPPGAFLLAAGLAGHGADVGLLDLSLELFHRVLHDDSLSSQSVEPSLAYLERAPDGYTSQRHRSATGALNKRLMGFGARYPGWKLTLMDITAPGRVHDPAALATTLADGQSPFAPLWRDTLDPILERHRPRRVLISLAYLSQLAATIDLVHHLAARGVRAVVGGSLPNSLAHTGQGLPALAEVLPDIELGDGRSLIAGGDGHLLDRLAWPTLLSSRRYLSARPVVPLALTTGCYWNRCLFCPDRGLPFVQLSEPAIAGLFDGLPERWRAARPVVHLLDSALPPGRLRRFLPLARTYGLDFYGFARPTHHLLRDELIERAAEHGCLMLQLGAEGGSGELLDRYDKGLDPAEAERVVQAAAGAGIRTYLYLLFGLPGETDADRQATLELVTRNADAIDFLNLSTFNLPRFSELTERADEFGIKLEDFPGGDDRLRLYRPFTTTDGRPREAARRFLEETFRPDPRARAILRRTPRWMRTAHLALMQLDGRRDP